MAEILTTRAVVAGERGEHAAAHTFFAAAIKQARAGGPRWLEAAILEGLATVAQRSGQPERAIRLLAAAATVRAAIGTPLAPSSLERYEHTLRAARAALGESAAATIWAEGASMPLEEIVGEAGGAASSAGTPVR